jgi:hypothetical protein
MNARIAAWLIHAFLLFGAASLSAGVPEPSRSTVPPYVYVVGTTTSGEPDPFGRVTVVVRNAFNDPLPNSIVWLDFSACCDIRLCESGIGHECAAGVVRDTTDGQGRCTFTVVGAARDPGTAIAPCQKEGCGAHAVKVMVNAGTGITWLGEMTAVALDQNGSAGGSNGTTGSDVSALILLFGAVATGSPYRGRGDIDANGSISGADVAALIAHFGRLSLLGGQGCAGSLCDSPDCAPAFFGPASCQP